MEDLRRALLKCLLLMPPSRSRRTQLTPASAALDSIQRVPAPEWLPEEDEPQWLPSYEDAGIDIRAHAYFDADLKPVGYRGAANGWLEVDLRCPSGDPAAWFYEVRTRFIVLADGRERQRSLEVARRVAQVQREWEEKFGLQFVAHGGASGAATPVACPSIATPLLVIRDQVLFDKHLTEIAGEGEPARSPALVVALVHPRDLPSHYECRIRTAWRFLAAGPGVRRSLAVCRAIAQRQQYWCERFGAPFYVYESVKSYVYGWAGKGRPPHPLRTFGRLSRPERARDVGALHLALDIIAHAWDEYGQRPEDCEALAFGQDRLACALEEFRQTQSMLRLAVKESLLLPAEAAAMLRAIDASELRRLPPHLIRTLRKSRYCPTNLGALLQQMERSSDDPLSPRQDSVPRPTPASAVFWYIRRAPDKAALTRFADKTKGRDRRPALTPALVRAVGEELGYLGHKRHKPRRDGLFDVRLFRLIARTLARRYRKPAATLLRTLVRPALSIPSPFSGPLVLADEAAVRKRMPARGPRGPRSD